MSLVGAGIGQRDFEGRDQVEFERVIAQVVQFDLAKLNVVLRADPHRGAGLQFAPQRLEHHPVGVEHALILRRRVGRRVLGERNGLRLLVPAQVNEAAQCVAQRVVAPAVDPGGPAPAVAGAVGAQGHVVAAVGQQVGRRQRGGARQYLAQQAGRSAHQGLWHAGCSGLERLWQLTRCALVQQRGHGLQVRIGHAPTLCHTAKQQVGQRHQAHALVVGHEGGHRSEAVATGLPRGGEIQCLDETVTPARAEPGQYCQVGGGAARCDQQGQRGGVGRDHQLVEWRASQRQPRHALRCVLVSQCLVTPGVSRFRNAPRHGLCLGEGHLLMQCGTAGFVEHAARRLDQHQRGHQVLEHRARP